MSSLVFLEPNKIDATPFTTSKAVADGAGIRHDKIKTSTHYTYVIMRKQFYEYAGITQP